MKYLYYTIHLFYKKIVRIEYWGDTPFFYCSIVIAVLQTFILFSCVNLYLLEVSKGEYVGYSPWWFFLFGMGMFLVNRFYFKDKKENIIKEISAKSKIFRNTIVILSIIFILIIIKMYFYTGDLIRTNNGF